MTTQALTAESFEETVLGNDIVLVDFWAAWCAPCRTFGPIFEEASATHPDIVFGKVDTEAEQSLAATAHITSIPTLMAFREGILVFSQPGALPATALEQVVAGVRALNMDEVHAEIAGPPPPSGPESEANQANDGSQAHEADQAEDTDHPAVDTAEKDEESPWSS